MEWHFYFLPPPSYLFHDAPGVSILQSHTKLLALNYSFQRFFFPYSFYHSSQNILHMENKLLPHVLYIYPGGLNLKHLKFNYFKYFVKKSRVCRKNMSNRHIYRAKLEKNNLHIFHNSL